MCFEPSIHSNHLLVEMSVYCQLCILHLFFQFSHGNEAMLESLNKALELKNLDEMANLKYAFQYTFPKVVNCVQTARDDSMFATKLVTLIGQSKFSPSIIHDIQPKIYGCNYYLLLCKNVTTMEETLTKLPKWANHRVLCLVNLGEANELETFLKANQILFGDAQVMVVLLSNMTIGYKIDQPVRTFEKLSIEQGIWEINNDGVLDFQGREIKVSTFNCTIFSKLGPLQENGRPTFFDGYDFHLFSEIISRINATYKVIPMNSTEQFAVESNGTIVGGMLHKIIDGEADIGFCGSLIESNKVALNLQMSVPIQLICFKYAVHRPPEVSRTILGVFIPFAIDTWITLIASVFAMSAGLLVLAKYISCVPTTDFDTKKYGCFGNCFLTLFGILVLGSWPKFGWRLGPIRHILAWWVVFTLLLTNSYTGILVSELATTKYSQKANYINEFLNHDFFWPVTQRPYNAVFDMDSLKYKKWLTRVRLVQTDSDLNKILKKNKKTVILTQEISNINVVFNEHVREDVLEDFETVNHCLTSMFAGFTYRLGSPFNNAFDFYIRNLRESGISQQKFNRVVSRMCKDRRSSFDLRIKRGSGKHKSATKMRMENLNGIFDLLLLGLLFSMVVFIFELSYNKMHDKDVYKF